MLVIPKMLSTYSGVLDPLYSYLSSAKRDKITVENCRAAQFFLIRLPYQNENTSLFYHSS